MPYGTLRSRQSRQIVRRETRRVGGFPPPKSTPKPPPSPRSIGAFAASAARAGVPPPRRALILYSLLISLFLTAVSPHAPQGISRRRHIAPERHIASGGHIAFSAIYRNSCGAIYLLTQMRYSRLMPSAICASRVNRTPHAPKGHIASGGHIA